jgi:hypothetical protein
MKIDTTRYPFPFIECGEHPGPQRSYVVCIHVIDGVRIASGIAAVPLFPL